MVCIGSGTIKCDSCDGSGKIECDYCGGSGNLECNKCFGSAILKCSNCNATGVIGDFMKISCLRCRGSGVNNGIPCTRCSGSGKINKDPDPCKVCGGTGQIKCETCSGGKIDCNYCTLGLTICNKCKGEGVTSCNMCMGEGKAGNLLQFKCDLCHGEGKKEIKYTVSSNPDLGHIHQMLALMYSKIEEGKTITSNQLSTYSKKMESRELVSQSQLTKISEKFTNVKDALSEMKRIQKEVITTPADSGVICCVECGYVPTGSLAESWLSAKDYDKLITCDACNVVFKL